MREDARFHFQNYVVIPNKESYLVLVEWSDEPPDVLNVADDLPAWMFETRLTVWVTNENASMFERSIAGEEVRNELMKQRTAAAV